MESREEGAMHLADTRFALECANAEVERLEGELERAAQEVAYLRGVVCQLHPLARRYADGRESYVTSALNALTRELLGRGVALDTPDGTPWARDRGGRGFDGLSEGEAALGMER
jgi:hypothetical protein